MLEPALMLVSSPAAQGPDMTQYLVVCVGLIAVVLGLAYGFRRIFSRAISARAARRSLQVVDVLPLGGKQRLAVVRCYDRTFVVGLGDKEVSLVAELDVQALPEPTAEPLPLPADQSAFQRLLQRAVPRAPRPQPAAAAAMASHTTAPARLAPEGWLG